MQYDSYDVISDKKKDTDILLNTYLFNQQSTCIYRSMYTIYRGSTTLRDRHDILSNNLWTFQHNWTYFKTPNVP